MNSRQAEKILRSSLRPVLATLSFSEYSPLCFAKKHPEHFEILNFPGRFDRGSYKFTIQVGIRFPLIEALIRPENDDITHPTISAPIHFLRPDREYFEWEFSVGHNLRPVMDSVKVEITSSATKFFERYANIASVEHDLRLGPSGMDWLLLSSMNIIAVLAAIAKLDGRIEETKKLVEEALADPKNNKPARRRHFESLKANLFGT